jgi:undecaprenyl pyrophosphate synthase
VKGSVSGSGALLVPDVALSLRRAEHIHFDLPRSELLHKHEVSVRVLGRVELLPIGLQRQLGKAVHVTRNYKR